MPTIAATASSSNNLSIINSQISTIIHKLTVNQDRLSQFILANPDSHHLDNSVKSLETAAQHFEFDVNCYLANNCQHSYQVELPSD